MLNFISKLPHVNQSIFSAMTTLCSEHQAVNLSQGFPDFETPNELINLVYRKMLSGHNQYAPMAGLLRLREILAEKIEHLHGYYYNPESEITITAGGTQAIFTAIATIIRPGDEAIIIEPAYDSYAPCVKIMGGFVKSITLEPPGYHINWQLLRRLISSQTKLIIINSPHNPTGTILDEGDMQELIKSVQQTDIMIVSDEVYEHIIFDGHTHLSVSHYPELQERSFVISSFGKIFHNTGWKVGYCTAPSKLMGEFRKIHQFEIFSVNTPIQYALADYLQEEEHYLQLVDLYTEKRNLFSHLLQGTKFKLLPCKGTYFLLAQYGDISDEPDINFAKRLIKDYGVGSIPISSFYTQNMDYKTLRFCFAKKDDTLKEAAERLSKI